MFHLVDPFHSNARAVVMYFWIDQLDRSGGVTKVAHLDDNRC